MKISIITPSFNSERYIENNLKSVHLQQNGDFNVEQIIIDGNSTDRTIDIIKSFKEKYNANIKIIQGKDKNMYDAINKGLKEMNGDIWACLNTDDLYNPQILDGVIKEFNYDPQLDVVYGYPDMIDEYGNFLFTLYLPKFHLDYFVLKNDCTIIFQPASFFRTRVLDNVGYFDINYNYAADYDYFIRVGSECKIKLIKKSFTQYRKHEDAITCNDVTRDKQLNEAKSIGKKYKYQFNVKEKNLFLNNLIFYIIQFKPNNINYILTRIYEITKTKSWNQFIKERVLR